MFEAIKYEVGDNMGGVNKLFVCPAHLLIYGDVLNGYLLNLAFANGGEWLEILCTQGSIQGTETNSATEAGDLKALAIEAVIAKQTPEKQIALESLKNVPCVVAFVDNNGFTKIAGSPSEPLFISTNNTTGAEQDSRNQSSISFTGNSTQSIPYLEGYANFNLTDSGELEFDNAMDPSLEASINEAGELILNGINSSKYTIDSTGNLSYNG